MSVVIFRFVYDPSTAPWPLISRIVTRLILFDSDDPEGYAHVEALTTSNTLIGAHSTGVEERPRNWDAGKFKRELFLALPATPEQVAKWEHYQRACIGEGYNYAAIFGFITHFNLTMHHRTICSGFQVLAARWCEVFPRELSFPAHRVSVAGLRLGLMMRPDLLVLTPDDPIFKAHISGA